MTSFDSNQERFTDENFVRNAVDAITAHCDSAVFEAQDRANDGRLWLPHNSDNLLMAVWKMPSPDFGKVIGLSGPTPESTVEVVARYWYGLRLEKINLWFRQPDSDAKNTFCIVVTSDTTSGDIYDSSSAGFGHDSVAGVNEKHTAALLAATFPNLQLHGTKLTDQFRDALWQSIDAGAQGHVREVYEKQFETRSKDGLRGMLNGFWCKVEQVNRTHLQDQNSELTINVNRTFWGSDYDGVYDGIATKSLTVEKDKDENIMKVWQSAKIRLFNQPYVQAESAGHFSEGPVDNVPDELKHLKEVNLIPSVDEIQWFLRIATQSVPEQDLSVFR